MKVARVLITPELMCYRMCFPEGTVLRDARIEMAHGAVYIALTVEHDDLKETTAIGPPDAAPQYERRDGSVVFVGWGQ